MYREIVSIDEDLCNGCGECVPACAEGAIRIVNGKAKLISDKLCDGLGACLGHCPQGAIKIERREAQSFDEATVRRQQEAALHVSNHSEPSPPQPVAPPACPSSRFAQFDPPPGVAGLCADSGHDSGTVVADSALIHWPVQLRLLPATAPVLRGARLLLAADCVPVAYAGFHTELLRDHAVAVACPKLDDLTGYIEKLTEMIQHNDFAEITVARMEVPCCGGILQMVLQARQLAESDVPVHDVLISVRGEILETRWIPVESKASSNGHATCCLNTRS